MDTESDSTTTTESDISEHGDSVWVREVLAIETKHRWGPESRHGMRVKCRYIMEFVEHRRVRGDGAVHERFQVWGPWKFAGIVGVFLPQFGVPPWVMRGGGGGNVGDLY